jgi:hypothetical protein
LCIGRKGEAEECGIASLHGMKDRADRNKGHGRTAAYKTNTSDCISLYDPKAEILLLHRYSREVPLPGAGWVFPAEVHNCPGNPAIDRVDDGSMGIWP